MIPGIGYIDFIIRPDRNSRKTVEFCRRRCPIHKTRLTGDARQRADHG